MPPPLNPINPAFKYAGLTRDARMHHHWLKASARLIVPQLPLTHDKLVKPMVVSIALTLFLALLTFTHWKNTTLASMVAPIIDTPYRYCYVSTWSRYIGVALSYCFVFFTIVWGSAYLLTNMLSALFGIGEISRSSWQSNTLPVLVLGIYGLCWLPGIRNFTLGLHKTVIRHLFFPILPSTGEEYAINQLLRATEAMDESGMSDLPINADSDIQRQLHSMMFVHDKLAGLLSGKGQPVKAMVYGEEWSLINSLYRSVFTQMQEKPDEFSPDLLNTVRLCQYYCCHLMVRYLFSTSLTAEQRHQRFHQAARPAVVGGI
jgi:hypothetical protein